MMQQLSLWEAEPQPTYKNMIEVIYQDGTRRIKDPENPADWLPSADDVYALYAGFLTVENTRTPCYSK